MNQALFLCVSFVLLGAARAELTSTNVTLPTESVTKEVDSDTSGVKLKVQVRTFNTTIDADNYPSVSCSVVGGSTGTTFEWKWANGTNLGADNDIQTSNTPAAGGATQVTSKLTFRTFAEKGALIVGEYKCLIEANTFRYPVVFSAPVVKMSEKDYRSSMEGDTMTQSCSIVAYPGAVITWTKDNQTLFAEGDRITFGADNATLIISELKQEDAGLYICTAENSLGLGQAYIKLKVKDRLAALWPFLGILAEVIILVTIILLYEKKRAAQKRSQEEQQQTVDGVNKDEQNANDTDVRHRPVKT